MKKPIKILGLVAASASISSCATVQPYDKAYLNDHDMELATKSAEKFEKNFLLYREAASGANGGKNGGGCGCN